MFSESITNLIQMFSSCRWIWLWMWIKLVSCRPAEEQKTFCISHVIWLAFYFHSFKRIATSCRSSPLHQVTYLTSQLQLWNERFVLKCLQKEQPTAPLHPCICVISVLSFTFMSPRLNVVVYQSLGDKDTTFCLGDKERVPISPSWLEKKVGRMLEDLVSNHLTPCLSSKHLFVS